MEYIALAARVCLSIIFIRAGINHALAFGSFQEAIASQGLPLVPLVAGGAIVFLLLGGLSVLVGYQVKVGVTLLILFLIPTTLIFHNPLANPDQWNSFLKNLGLIGGLLMTLYAGAGAISLNSQQGRSSNSK
jgi:putative oxidoreductase